MRNYPLAKPVIEADDIEAVVKVLKSQHLSRGPVVKQFENEFCQLLGCRYASAVSSGSAGLIIALQALGVKSGDEVITVSFTVPATVNSIVAIGAKPVMVDIEEETLGMCPLALSKAIGPKTSAIIIVHAFGKSANMDQLLEIAKTHGVKVIEDSCEALGNNYENAPLGTMADIGVFGFYPNKQITTGEGGMIVTNNEEIYSLCELLKNHGRSMNGDLYDQESFGWNFRLSDINAALGISQIKRLERIITKRRKIAKYYYSFLKQETTILCPQFKPQESGSAWFVYVVRLLKNNRDEVLNNLQKKGVHCGRYFAPVHLQPYYQANESSRQLKTTELIASQCLALPFYTDLKGDDINYICDKLLKNTI
ncbi:MAG: DegT/DnrJ/EryC1/StrS family aminotransferase [Marinicellaceae bacterium]